MARLIVKSPYIKCGGSGSASGYMNYIAMRERVELIQDDRPPTRKQEQLIAKLIKDFPDSKELLEYGDYLEKPTKANASAFITLALESNWDAVQSMDGYMKYIATRPRAERLGSHGLFGAENHIDLDAAMAELDAYNGNVWTHIISLHREDAERLGYNNVSAWQNLLRTHRNDIAAAMNIPPGDFRWYAAYHDESEHPHVHMMAWSVRPGQAYLNSNGIRKIKSELTNDIFRHEMFHLYEQKTESRNELVRKTRKALQELTRQMQNSICDYPEVESLMQEMAVQLGTVSGKKSYGYLPKKQKALVDEIVDQMEQLPVVSKCYETWWTLQCQVDDYYAERARMRPPLSKQKEFRQIKNAVIREAERIRIGEASFENGRMAQEDESEISKEMSFDYWTLRDIIRDDTLPMAERDDAVSQMEQLAQSGDMYAQYLMGKLWRDGPLLIPDWVNARYWFEKAAMQDHVTAQYALGKLYLSGDMEVHNTQEGLRWLETAAQNGSHYAAYRLGKEYLKGKIAGKDTAQAIKWFTRSAEAGNQHAQYMLGKLYLMGQEIPCDKEQAIYWLSRPAAQGNEYAQFFLDRQNDFRPPSVMLSVTRLLHHMSWVFQDHSLPQSGNGIQMDRKRRWQLREKKIALGHKADDHEEQTQGGPSMMM